MEEFSVALNDKWVFPSAAKTEDLEQAGADAVEKQTSAMGGVAHCKEHALD